MNEEMKTTLNNMKTSAKEVFTSKNLKKGASILILLAVVGAGGKYMLHQNRVEAKAKADEARTTLLQNLAAQKNIPLVGTDAVKNTVAQALGADAAQIKFESVNLISPQWGKDGGGEHERDEKQERREKRSKGEKHEERSERGDKYARADGRDRGEDSLRGDKKMRGDRQQFGQGKQNQERMDQGDRGSMMPLPPQGPGQAGQAQPAAPEQANSADQQINPAPQAPAQAGKMSKRQGGEPLLYSVKCSKDNVEYHFVVGAQDGKILRSSVEPAHSFFGK